MALGRCTTWVHQLPPRMLESLERFKRMCCLGEWCSGWTQYRSQNPAHSGMGMTVVQNEGDIEALGVTNGGMYDQQDNQHPMPSQIGAPKKNKFPYVELVSLFQVVLVSAIGTLGMVSWTLLSCEKWWVPTVLFSSIAVAVVALASWIVNEHLISNFKVVFFVVPMQVLFFIVLVLYLGLISGVILVFSNQILCHG